MSVFRKHGLILCTHYDGSFFAGFHVENLQYLLYCCVFSVKTDKEISRRTARTGQTVFPLRNRRKTGGFWVSFLERNLISTSGKCHAFRRAQIAEPFLRRFLLRSRRKTGRFSRLRRGNRHENGRQDACGEVRGISPTGAKRAVNDATRNPGRISPSNCAVLP